MKTRIATKAQSSVVRVRLQLDPAKLCQLIAAGHLCATDFVCLDCGSRDVLKRIFLQCSTRWQRPPAVPRSTGKELW